MKRKKNNTDNYDVLVEKRFAKDNNIKLGDILKIKMGEEFYDFCVSKIVSVPETIGNVPINGMWVTIRDYGNIYINKNVLSEVTNKKKAELLNTLEKKEEELLNEEENKLDEYNKAKNKLDKSINEYNTKKAELSKKKDYANIALEKVTDLKNEYIEITDSASRINNAMNSYINTYDNLSNDAKDYLDSLVESRYPDITVEDLEFIADISYSIFQNNLNELFDPSNEKNEELKNKIMIADIIKAVADSEYDYFNSDEVVNLIGQIEDGLDVTGLPEYQELKNKLELFRIVTDDNITYVYDIAKTVLDEIHSASEKLPFDSFSDMYDFIDSNRVLLPFVYNSYKGELKPYFEQVVSNNESVKAGIKNEIDSIYNSNKSAIQKAKEITSKVYNYTKDTIEEAVISALSDYTDNTEGGGLDVINRFITSIDEYIKEIDDGLDKAHSLINSNKAKLEASKKVLDEKVLEAKEELNNKKAEIENIHGLENKFNEILIYIDNSSDRDVVLNNVLNNYLKDIEVLDSYTYEGSPMYYYINVNIDVMEKLSVVVPILFYLVILIVLYLFISLMIMQGKKEIAILRLLGKTNNDIRIGFCISNLIVAIIGLVLGFLIGLFPMIYMVEYFKNFFLLPDVFYVTNGISILFCIIATIVVVELATINATAGLDKITPIEILKNEGYQNKETSKFIKWLASKFKPFHKFGILVYVRNKSRLILGIVCTSATVTLIFSSLAYIASKNKIFNQYFDDRIQYTAQIFKNGEISDEELDELRNLDYVESADLLRYFNVKLEHDNKQQDIVINALDNTNKYIRIYDKNYNEIDYPENGIVLEEHIAKDLGLKLNDEITIDGVKFKIVNLSFQSMGRINYISLNDSYKLKPSFDTIVLNMDKDKQNDLLVKESSKDNYIYTVFNDEIRQHNKAIFDSYTIPAVIIIIFVLFIGNIIVININAYNILDQKKNLAVFRGLGFQYNEISKCWFVQSLIQWIASLIIGIPTGMLLSRYILKFISSVRREFIYASGITEIIFTTLLLFLYIYVGHRKSMRNIKKIDIIEEVKDKD